MNAWTMPSFAVAFVLALALPAPARSLGTNLIRNGGFEDGAAGWHFTGPYDQPAGPDAGLGAEVITSDSHSGTHSLRIDTRGRDAEVDAYSDAFAVEPGLKYALSSFVRLIAPQSFGFKVTIDWLNAAGEHLQYDNDWRGNASSHEWLEHGGDFTAPDSAKQARIILGILPGAVMLFDDIALRDIGPSLEITTLATSTAICTAGRPADLLCAVRNSGGRAVVGVRGALGLEGSLQPVTVGDIAPNEEKLVAVEVVLSAPGTALARAEFASDNAPAVETTAPIVAITDSAEADMTLTSGAAELRFIESGFGHGVIEVTARDGGRSQIIGAIRALAELQIDGEPARLVYASLHQEGNAVGGAWRGDACDLAFRFTPAAPGWFSVRCELTARRDFDLRALTCPEFHFGWHAGGAKKDSALFCGLEYLTGAEESSGTESVAPDLAPRYIPHPNKVTVPLMAVANEGWAAGLAWDPLQRWDSEHDRPSAVFASPNRLDREDDHLMALFVPSVPDFANENESAAARPCAIKAGQTITLASELFVLPAPRNVCDVMPEWYRTHQLPDLPEASRDLRAQWAHSIDALMRGWSDERKQWRAEAHRDYAFHPDIAMRLLNYAIHNDDARAAAALRQVWEGVEKVVANNGPGRLGLDLALHFGHVRENLGGLAAGADVANAQREDGSWPFAPSEQTTTLGKAGDTALGICCEPILRLLKVAARTGDERSLRAALRGLEYVEANFRRPAGGETWEIPLHAPNLRAAALAVECGVTAYELTGDRRYLDMARYWGRSGLPFIYTWRAADREAMRFATISVFGATFYTFPWFGRAVQWVGMVYSRALQRLAPYDRSLPWGHIAEGIVLSCIQQERMAERPDANNPWPGAFPDSYSLIDGRVYGAWIGPQSIVESLENLLDMPATDFALVGERPEQVRIISAARIAQASLGGGRLTAVLTYPAGSTCHSVLTCIDKPSRVLVDDGEIPEVADLDQVPTGWWADTARGYLVIKHRSRTGEIQLVVEGVRFVGGNVRKAARALMNPGFEQGMAGWTGEGVVVQNDAHRGKRALLIDGAGAADEQQAVSEMVAVLPDTQYELEAWVKLLTEKTGYKVTIDWLDANGRHIAYDNDWRGEDRPARWSHHGGVFRSPKSAASARLILGVHPGVAAMFDDIALPRRLRRTIGLDADYAGSESGITSIQYNSTSSSV